MAIITQKIGTDKTAIMHTFRQLIEDNKTRRLSSSRFISVCAGTALSLSTVILTIGAFWRPEMLGTLSVIAPSVAGLGGANYAVGRWAGKGA